MEEVKSPPLVATSILPALRPSWCPGAVPGPLLLREGFPCHHLVTTRTFTQGCQEQHLSRRRAPGVWWECQVLGQGEELGVGSPFSAVHSLGVANGAWRAHAGTPAD